MNPAALEALILKVLRESPEISPPEHLPEAVTVERPKNRDHGDYATNIALTLTKAVGKPPREIAEAIASKLLTHADIAAADVAGPGFLNITF